VDLLPGWYDDWVIFERERIRQRVLHALEALSCELVRRGRCAEAIEVALDAVGVEPLRESAQRVLIEAHLAEGNLVEARRLYLRYRELVRQELRTEPGTTLTRLVVDAGRPAPTNGRPHHADAGYVGNGHSQTPVAGVAALRN
ncbi:bacterial transcriptional activator domain-containing protein, partial [Georgenia sp. 10Sc9-8]|nr:bacterial transcriptional activator domain-containing protein [Georgenia halotolerans]